MTPKTEIELEKWMKDNCFNFNSYSINGNAIYEGFGIDKIGGQFIWYYTERGQKDNIKYFNNEKELIEYAYNQIKSDKWAKTHCIGFTTDKTKTSELANRLEKMNIEFMKDEIPYYGLERPVYRTFVFGCDYLKVSDLRKQYYEEK
jgi:hypothetical protein